MLERGEREGREHTDIFHHFQIVIIFSQNWKILSSFVVSSKEKNVSIIISSSE